MLEQVVRADKGRDIGACRVQGGVCTPLYVHGSPRALSLVWSSPLAVPARPPVASLCLLLLRVPSLGGALLTAPVFG